MGNSIYYFSLKDGRKLKVTADFKEDKGIPTKETAILTVMEEKIVTYEEVEKLLPDNRAQNLKNYLEDID